MKGKKRNVTHSGGKVGQAGQDLANKNKTKAEKTKASGILNKHKNDKH